MNFNIQEITALIPHRPPFLLIDRVIDLVENKSAVGIKNVSMNEWFFVGHFPSKPVMPGVLIVEAMAQTACVLVAASGAVKTGALVYFTAIEEAKFKRMVVPGDTLHLKVSIDRYRLKLWKMEGVALVNGEVACEAKFSAMVGS